jgi:adenylate cyclase
MTQSAGKSTSEKSKKVQKVQFTDPKVARRVLYLLALVTLIIGPLSYRLPLLGEPLTLLSIRSYDLLLTGNNRFRRWWNPVPEPPQDVVVVGVDEASLEKYGRWPWNRSVMADLILGLKEFGVKTTAMDVLFAEPQWSPLADLQEVLDTLPPELQKFPFLQTLETLPSLEKNLRSLPQKYQEHPAIQQIRRRLVPPWEDEILARSFQEAGNVILGLVIQRLEETQGELSWFSEEKSKDPPPNAVGLLMRRTQEFSPEELQEAWNQNLFSQIFFEEAHPFTLLGLRKDRLAALAFPSSQPYATGLALPLPGLLEHAAGAGFMNDQVVSDAVVRKMPLGVVMEEIGLPSLVLSAISHSLGGTPELQVNDQGYVEGVEIVRGEGADRQVVLRFDTGREMDLWINFYGARLQQAVKEGWNKQSLQLREEPVLEVVPAYQVLDAYRSIQSGQAGATKQLRERLRERLQGRIAFVGATAFGLTDIRSTPIGEFRPGVEVHASVAANILEGRTYLLRPVEFFLGMGSSLVFLLVLAFVLPRLKPVEALSFFVLEASVAVLWCWICLRFGSVLFPWDLLFPMGLLLAGGLAFLNLVENREKAWIDGMFKRYVSADYVEMIKANKGELDLNGREAIITPYFSDMASFSTISEAFTAAGLFRFLGEYLGEMGDILDEYGGTLDKFEGDAVVAFFGAPIHFPDHASKACLACLHMQERVRELESEWQTSDRYPELHSLAKKHGKWFPIRVRHGLNTGPCATGHLGTAERGNYTMMGDTVNLAARLESAGKQYGISMTISEETRKYAEDAVETRPVDIIQVVGRTVGTHIFEILGRKGELPPEKAQFLALYRDAWDYYMDQQFEKAREKYLAALELQPGDKVCKIFLERCQSFLVEPPPEEWDGVFVLTSK